MSASKILRRALRAACGAGLPVILAALACGGGGGGGGGGPTNPPAPPGVSFSASKAPTKGSCFLKQGPQTSSAKLFLEVRVNDVDDWYGVAFDLSYPTNLLSYVRVTEGGFPGGSTALEVTEVAGGRLIVGHTRLGNATGRDGSGLLMTLEFNAGANGSAAFGFDNEQAFGTNSFPQAAEFIAGTVSVNN